MAAAIVDGEPTTQPESCGAGDGRRAEVRSGSGRTNHDRVAALDNVAIEA